MQKIYKIIGILMIVILLGSCDSVVKLTTKIPTMSPPSLAPVNIQKSQTPALPTVQESVKQALQKSIQPPLISPTILPSAGSSTLPIIDEISPSSGSSNDYCSIKGKNFGEKGGRVTFSRKNSSIIPEVAKLIFWSDERIVINPPDIDSFTYEVNVETGNNEKSNTKEFVLFEGVRGGGGGGGGGGWTPPPPPGGNPVPTLTSISPTGTLTGGPDFTLTLNGNNFVSNSLVNFKGIDISSSYLGPTQLTALLPASAISVAGTVYVYVKNPSPGGGNSSSLPFNVGNPNPVPSIISISPTECLINSSDFTLTANGNSFIGSSYITFNGQVMTTTYMSSTQVSCTIPTSKVLSAGTVQVTVINPAPGGGTTAPQNFTAKYQVPTITQLNPWYVTPAGTVVLVLRIIGTNFYTDTTVKFAGADYPASYVNSTELQIYNVTQTTPSGEAKVVEVTNPSPGGGTVTTNFYIDNPAPIITSFSPTAAVNGGEGVLKILGYNFLADNKTTVTFKGNAKTVTYISANEIRINMDIGDTGVPGIYPLEIINEGPGGGTNSKNFTITGTVATISGLGGGQHAKVTYYALENLALVASGSANKLHIINLNDPPTLETSINLNWPAFAAIHTGKKIAVVSALGEGCVKIIDLNPANGTYEHVIQSIPGMSNPKYIYVDEGTNRAYVTGGGNQHCRSIVDKIDLDTYTLITNNYNIGNCINNTAYNPVDGKIIGLDVPNSKFYIFDTLGGVTSSLNMNSPKFIKMDIPNQRAFINSRDSNNIRIIDLNTYQTIKTYGASYGLQQTRNQLDYDAVNNRIAAGNHGYSTVSIINLTTDTSYLVSAENIGHATGVAFISNNRLIVVDRNNGNADIIQLP